MIFGNTKRKDFTEQIFINSINSIPIEEKPEVKYLVVHTDNNSTFRGEIKYILQKTAQAFKNNLRY